MPCERLPRDERLRHIPFAPFTGRRCRQADEGLPTRRRRNSYRFKLPNIPRTSARPTWVATVRATLFIAASTTVSRW
ncbi:hypothetical protein EHI42_32405 [Rhizobium hidalgonense]|nr:hypothetical protein EHI42_32405 [Rhizobium hidalgonense]